MITSLTQDELRGYISRQLSHLLPDNRPIDELIAACLDGALGRLEYCLDRVILQYQKKEQNGELHTYFNHLHSDQYAMFLYLLSNELWQRYHDFDVASKVMYLNKILHAINCMYEVELPKIFYFYHTVGTVIGKSAAFSDYMVICHGVTVGAQSGKGAVFEEGVSLLPKSSVVGDSHIGFNSSVGIGTTLYNTDMPSNHIAYTDKLGAVNIKASSSCYADTVFCRF